jgi:hypothetical protein
MTSIPLRQLEADLQKTVAVTTSEIETEEGDCKGMYLFREDDGSKFMWSPTPTRYGHHDVATVAEADHIMFLCPKCFTKNGGSVGTHAVMVTFAGRNVPDEASSHDADGKPSRWTASGTTIDNLVLTPSILLDAKRKPTEGCHWHGFVGSSGIPAGHAGPTT